MSITDELLFSIFEGESLSYAVTPYIDREEYLRDKRLMEKYNSSSNPQDNFLLIMAAKVERTDPEVLGKL